MASLLFIMPTGNSMSRMPRQKPSSKRVVFRIQLTPDAKQALLSITSDLGITQIAVTSKLVEWFSSQPDMIQAAVLGLYPDVIKQDVAELILEQMRNPPQSMK